MNVRRSQKLITERLWPDLYRGSGNGRLHPIKRRAGAADVRYSDGTLGAGKRDLDRAAFLEYLQLGYRGRFGKIDPLDLLIGADEEFAGGECLLFHMRN